MPIIVAVLPAFVFLGVLLLMNHTSRNVSTRGNVGTRYDVEGRANGLAGGPHRDGLRSTYPKIAGI